MTIRLQLIQIGQSVGVVLPDEVLARLKVQPGDTLLLTEGPNGVNLTPCELGRAEQVGLGRDFMDSYRETFQRLAE